MFAAVCQLGRRLMAGTLTPEASTERTIIVADLIVSTQSSNEAILNTLVGPYLERGINHGRKFYQKIVYGHDPSVFLYFWDHRDGRA